MNYGQLKNELASLGFSDIDEIEEFGAVVPEALNRAITEINTTVSPNIGTYEFEQDGTEKEILYYNMTQLTKKDGIVKFLGFADTPVMIGTNVYKRYNDFEIENGDTLVIDGTVIGEFKVLYKKAHTPFTKDTDDTVEIELPLKVQHLVPLLTAYYVWLEDEKSKAVDYYNQYEKLAQAIINENEKPRMRILSGGI